MTTGQPGAGKACPRCGLPSGEPDTALCAACRQQLASEADVGSGLTIHLSPIIRDALAQAQPGEDIDEALLRALKVRYPKEAAALLPAITQLIAAQTGPGLGGKDEALRRMAAAEPGPEIKFRSSGGSSPIRTTITTRQVITVNGKTYPSLDEVPPSIRRAIQSTISGGAPDRQRVGCSIGLLAALVSALIARR